MTIARMTPHTTDPGSWDLTSIYAVGYEQARPAPAHGRHLYADDGCEIASHCLECPLPACRYDMPPKRAAAIMREAQLRKLLASGLTANQAAVKMGVSRRTVFRLKRYGATAAAKRSQS